MVVGITGSIASGKSLVTSFLQKKGYSIIDCDEISHEVLYIEEVIDKIKNAFGEEVLDKGHVNRQKLGKIIFDDYHAKTKLESIVFPYIVQEIKKQLNEKKGLVFLDAPLLIEYKLQYLVDKIIVIKTNKEVQLQRLINRDNITDEYANKKINSQLPSEEKEKYADYLIDNSLDYDNTYKQINEILKQLEEL